LITHGPPFGHLDISGYGNQNVGCELLRERIDVVKPLIHCFGHIHGSRNIKHTNGTLFVNASILDERYNYVNKPIHVEFDFETLEYEIIQI
jgi:Icc-related predicted phosphoesterase